MVDLFIIKANILIKKLNFQNNLRNRLKIS